MSSLLVRNGTILTMNDRLEVVHGAVTVRDRRIVSVGPEPPSDHAYDVTIDARGGLILPGFVQTHVHLCQTLFRGLADDLPLLDWLRKRIWPLEAAHSPDSLRASTRLAAAELIQTGTTTVLTMETVHHTEVVLEELNACGLRATVGKCMMDSAAEAPARLQEDTNQSISEALELKAQWHGQSDGRLRVAFAPRFAVSCSRTLLEAVASLSNEDGLIVHTHASEARDEIELVRSMVGLSNVQYLGAVGLATPRLCLAHCVWVDEGEQDLLAEREVKVLHCPGLNLKLGFGIAPVVKMRERGISVSLGTDGGACNNHLDMFSEMRLAATLQAVRYGPGSLPADAVLRMATREGARALGLDAEIGSVEVGKRADLIVVDLERPHLAPGRDPYSTVVYAARGTDVRATVVDGEVLVRDFALLRDDPAEIAARAREAAGHLVARAGLTV